jgi:hypothetical protein
MNDSFKRIIFFCGTVLAVYFLYELFYDGTQHFLSTIDNKMYKVRDPNKQLKANLLGTLNQKLNVIVDSLRTNKDYYHHVNVLRLINNWDSGITIKEIGKMESDAAYVINKRHMSFCLKDFNKGNQVDVNLLTYVGIHELSHVMSDEVGHGDEFKNNFKFLLDYSKKLAYNGNPLYISLNELKTPNDYCGVSIINSIN